MMISEEMNLAKLRRMAKEHYCRQQEQAAAVHDDLYRRGYSDGYARAQQDIRSTASRLPRARYSTLSLHTTMTEPFDLNVALAEAYIKWQQTYLTGMLQLPAESVVDYCDRMCCIAFMEGAKTVQGMVQQAFVESLAEAMK